MQKMCSLKWNKTRTSSWCLMKLWWTSLKNLCYGERLYGIGIHNKIQFTLEKGKKNIKINYIDLPRSTFTHEVCLRYTPITTSRNSTMWFLLIINLTLFFQCIYFTSLHVSCNPVLIIRRYWYNWFSWWWALGWTKHVEKWNKYIEKRESSWLLTRIIPRRCTVNKTSNSTLWFSIFRNIKPLH
jgi:hypothetical protein